MHPILRNILATIAGLIIGSAVNMGLVEFLPMINPLPEGFDAANMDDWTNKIEMLEFRHFLNPFIAHAMGTLVGAFVAVKVGVSKHVVLAMLIGIFFLLGGTAMSMMIPVPMWFTCIDLSLAYFPMALLGYKLAGGGK